MGNLACPLPLRVWWGIVHKPVQILSPQEGQENNTAKQLPAGTPPTCLHTTHPHVVKLLFPMKMKVEGEAC